MSTENMEVVEPQAETQPTETNEVLPSDTSSPEVESDPLAPLPDKDAEDKAEKSSDEIDELPLPDEDNKDKKEKLPKWVEKKLSKKDRELQEALYNQDLLRQKLASVNLESSQFNNPSTFDPNAPTRDQFANEDEFIDARIDYKNRKDAVIMNHKAQLQAREESEVKFINSFEEIKEAGSEKYEDFDEKTEMLFSKSFPGNRPMAEAIAESEFNKDILYFLGMYPDKAIEIVKMEPVKAIKKIAEIEHRFKAAMQKKSTTKAPPVIKLVTSSSSGTASEPSVAQVEKMSPDDFEKWYHRKFG